MVKNGASDVIRILAILKDFTQESYRARSVRFIHGPPQGGRITAENFDAFYSWLVNDWIVNQPDSDRLMELFILLGFNVEAFAAAVTGQFEKWAKGSIVNANLARDPDGG